jgi:hypothetical protein
MWDRSSSHIAPYQWLLRAVGDYLDSAGARHIQIMELSGGFAVRYEVGADPPAHRLVELSYDELLQFRSRMEGARAGRRPTNEPQGRYQDFLRALGHDLEQAGAYFILLDEVGDDFLITYQYLQPTQGYQPHKHLSVINRDTREDLLQRAYSRRQAPQRRFSLLRR